MSEQPETKPATKGERAFSGVVYTLIFLLCLSGVGHVAESHWSLSATLPAYAALGLAIVVSSMGVAGSFSRNMKVKVSS